MSNDEPIKPCEDKLVFDTKREAQAIALTLKHQRGTDLRAYKCRFCELWHLTST